MLNSLNLLPKTMSFDVWLHLMCIRELHPGLDAGLPVSVTKQASKQQFIASVFYLQDQRLLHNSDL